MDDFTKQQMKIPVVIKEEPIDEIDEKQLCTIEMEKQQMKIPVVIKEEPIDEIDEEQVSTIEMEKQQMNIPVVIKEEPIDVIDEEKLFTIEMIKIRERILDLEWIVVPEQDGVIEHTTQILNIWDQHKRRRINGPVAFYPFSPEQLQHLRLLLIAALRRTDAILEVRRLHVESAFIPVENMLNRFTDLTAYGDGKTLVIESLRIPILSSLNGGGNHNKIKHNSNDGLETRWPGGYRYFVCTIRASSTLYRPPMTAASRPVDAVEESALRLLNDATKSHNKDETNYGYVEFITEKREMNSGSLIHTGPTESDGAPIMINGLDDRKWNITVDLYGVAQTDNGENDHHSGGNNVKEHDVHKNRSVLDKLSSATTTPSHGSTAKTYMVTSHGPIPLNNTVIQQLGYFVFSADQVDLEQFTLNKMHQSGCVPSNSRVTTNAVAEETVYIRMCFLN